MAIRGSGGSGTGRNYSITFDFEGNSEKLQNEIDILTKKNRELNDTIEAQLNTIERQRERIEELGDITGVKRLQEQIENLKSQLYELGNAARNEFRAFRMINNIPEGIKLSSGEYKNITREISEYLNYIGDEEYNFDKAVLTSSQAIRQFKKEYSSLLDSPEDAASDINNGFSTLLNTMLEVSSGMEGVREQLSSLADAIKNIGSSGVTTGASGAASGISSGVEEFFEKIDYAAKTADDSVRSSYESISSVFKSLSDIGNTNPDIIYSLQKTFQSLDNMGGQSITPKKISNIVNLINTIKNIASGGLPDIKFDLSGLTDTKISATIYNQLNNIQQLDAERLKAVGEVNFDNLKQLNNLKIGSFPKGSVEQINNITNIIHDLHEAVNTFKDIKAGPITKISTDVNFDNLAKIKNIKPGKLTEEFVKNFNDLSKINPQNLFLLQEIDFSNIKALDGLKISKGSIEAIAELENIVSYVKELKAQAEKVPKIRLMSTEDAATYKAINDVQNQIEEAYNRLGRGSAYGTEGAIVINDRYRSLVNSVMKFNEEGANGEDSVKRIQAEQFALVQLMQKYEDAARAKLSYEKAGSDSKGSVSSKSKQKTNANDEEDVLFLTYENSVHVADGSETPYLKAWKKISDAIKSADTEYNNFANNLSDQSINSLSENEYSKVLDLLGAYRMYRDELNQLKADLENGASRDSLGLGDAMEAGEFESRFIQTSAQISDARSQLNKYTLSLKDASAAEKEIGKIQGQEDKLLSLQTAMTNQVTSLNKQVFGWSEKIGDTRSIELLRSYIKDLESMSASEYSPEDVDSVSRSYSILKDNIANVKNAIESEVEAQKKIESASASERKVINDSISARKTYLQTIKSIYDQRKTIDTANRTARRDIVSQDDIERINGYEQKANDLYNTFKSTGDIDTFKSAISSLSNEILDGGNAIDAYITKASEIREYNKLLDVSQITSNTAASLANSMQTQMYSWRRVIGETDNIQQFSVLVEDMQELSKIKIDPSNLDEMSARYQKLRREVIDLTDSILKEVEAKRQENAEARSNTKDINLDNKELEYLTRLSKLRDKMYSQSGESVKQSDLYQKNLDLSSSLNDLKSSYDQGEISQQEYSDGLARIRGEISEVDAATQTYITSISRQRKEEDDTTSAVQRRASLLREAESMQTKYNNALINWTSSQYGKSSDSYNSLLQNSNALSQLIREFESAGENANMDEFKLRVTEIGKEFTIAAREIKSAGENTLTFGERMKAAISKFSSWFSVTRVVMRAVQSIKKMVSTAVELDKSMTQLRIVTGATDSQMSEFSDTAVKLANNLGKSVSEVVNSIETFSRLGYSLEDASKLAEYASILSNVAAVDTSEATTGLTSIIKGFNMDISNVEHVADVLIEVGQKYAVSASELMEAFEKSGAALNATNTSFEKSAGLVAAANASIQNASTVGKLVPSITVM